MVTKRKLFLICPLAVSLFLFCLVAGSWAAETAKPFRILHINDFHGFALPHELPGQKGLFGGIAFLAAKVNDLRGGKPSILLSAGDMIQGNIWANFSEGKSVIDVMNTMKFDGMVVGNHEFDYGQEVLRERIKEARFPVLGANVSGLSGLQPFMVMTVNGATIGVIGVVTTETPVTTSPKNVRGLTFAPVAETVRFYAEMLRPGVDVLVVLSHLGFVEDMELARTVQGIDLIVGGHSHTKVENGRQVGSTLVVQAWAHGLTVGVVDGVVEDGKITALSARLEDIVPVPGADDRKITSLVQAYEEKVGARMNEVVGRAVVPLDMTEARRKESNLGNLVADILRSTAAADGAIINGGGLRESIMPGPVRVRDIYSALPFDNYLIAIKLTGRQIVSVLEHGVSGVEEDAGRFPQVSGIHFRFDPRAPKGSRIRSVIVGGRPIDPDGVYTVATNDFLVAGGDGYKGFADALTSSKNFSLVGGVMTGDRITYNDASTPVRDLVTRYFREKGTVHVRLDGRIEIVD